MKRYTHLTELGFEPRRSERFDVTATGTDVAATPEVFREHLGDLARLEYVIGEFRAVVEWTDPESTAVVKVRLTDGTTDYATLTLSADGGTRVQEAQAGIDLSNVGGSTELYIAVDVDTAAATANWGYVSGVLRVRHPLSVLGGC